MAVYVKNKDLREEIIKSQELGELTPKALDMLILMCHKFAFNFTYNYVEDKEDCTAFAIMNCWTYWRKYDPSISENAFSYYTQIIKNGYALGWAKLGYKDCPYSSRVNVSHLKNVMDGWKGDRR